MFSRRPPRPMPRILLIARDREFLNLVDGTLTDSGYLVLSAGNVRAGAEACRAYAPHLILLDLLIGGESKIGETLRLVQACAKADRTPILLLCGRRQEKAVPPRMLAQRRILTAPLSPSALQARVAEILRAQPPKSESKGLTVGPLQMDVVRRDVRAGDTVVHLTRMEYQVLRALIDADGRVLSREALVAAVRGWSASVVGRSVDNHVAALRRKLGASGALLVTVRGYGYRLSQESATPAK